MKFREAQVSALIVRGERIVEFWQVIAGKYSIPIYSSWAEGLQTLKLNWGVWGFAQAHREVVIE